MNFSGHSFPEKMAGVLSISGEATSSGLSPARSLGLSSRVGQQSHGHCLGQSSL